jgi:hypothetical protein
VLYKIIINDNVFFIWNIILKSSRPFLIRWRRLKSNICAMTFGACRRDKHTKFRDAVDTIFTATITALTNKFSIVFLGFAIGANVLSLFVHGKYLQLVFYIYLLIRIKLCGGYQPSAR